MSSLKLAGVKRCPLFLSKERERAVLERGILSGSMRQAVAWADHGDTSVMRSISPFHN